MSPAPPTRPASCDIDVLSMCRPLPADGLTWEVEAQVQDVRRAPTSPRAAWKRASLLYMTWGCGCW